MVDKKEIKPFTLEQRADEINVEIQKEKEQYAQMAAQKTKLETVLLPSKEAQINSLLGRQAEIQNIIEMTAKANKEKAIKVKAVPKKMEEKKDEGVKA